MNIEICKNCPNRPKLYLLGGSKDKISLFGYKDMKDGGTRLSCIVSYTGMIFDKSIANKFEKHVMPTASIEKFLRNGQVIPVETICPYYTEHLMSEWNSK